MSALGHAGTALLVIDMQREVVSNAVDVDRVVSNINELVAKARQGNAPVIWVQHSDEDLERGTDGWELIDALVVDENDPVVHKLHGDSFAGTNLQEILEAHQVGRVVVTGAQTDACIRSTLHGALSRGYDVTLASDAHTTEDMRPWGSPIGPEEAIAYTNLYWGFSTGPDCRGESVRSAEVHFGTV